MIGLYGVMAYSVTRRTRDIGIRMALGALSSTVARMILREVAILVAIGIIIALPAAWGASRYIATQFYGVAPTDPATIVLAIVGLITVAAAAGLIHALRAVRVNPIGALRCGRPTIPKRHRFIVRRSILRRCICHRSLPG